MLLVVAWVLDNYFYVVLKGVWSRVVIRNFAGWCDSLQKVDEENVAEFGAPSVGQVVLNKNNDDE